MAEDTMYARDEEGNRFAYVNGEWIPADQGNMFGDVGQTLMQASKYLPGPLRGAAQAAGGMMTVAPEQTMSIASGASLGFADEGLAAAKALEDYRQGRTESPMESYDEHRNRINQQMAVYRQESPIESTLLEVGGGLLTGGVGAGRAGALTGLRRVAALGGTGAAYGGLAGAGYAEPGERMKGAAGGALMGGVLGTALPLAGQGIRAAARYPAERFGLRGGQQAARRMAQQEVRKGLERASMTPQQAGQYTRTLGQEGMLADVPALQPLARGITAVPGKAQQVGLKTTAERAAARNTRVVNNINNALGADDFYSTIDDITARQRELSAPLYKSAMSATANIDDVVKYTDDILAKSKGKIANQIRRVSSMLTRDGVPESSMEVLHGVKMEIDDMISTARRQGQNNAVRQLVKIKSRLLDKMDDVEVGGEKVYKQARKIFADEASNTNAMEQGLKFLRSDAEITTKMIKNMSDSEREMFRIGVAKALKDKILSSPEGADAWKRIMGNQAMRNKIRAAFPNNKTFKEFQQMMKREAQFARTKQSISGGSPTARIQAEVADIGELADVATGNTTGVIMGAIKTMLNKLKMPPESVRDELADILFSKGYTKNQQMLKELLDEVSKAPKKTRDFMGEIIARLITRETMRETQQE